MFEYAAMCPQAWGWGRKSEERLVPSLRKYTERNSSTRTKAISSCEWKVAREQCQDTPASQALGRHPLTNSAAVGSSFIQIRKSQFKPKHVPGMFQAALHPLPHQKTPFTKRRGSPGFLALSWSSRPKC